VKRLNAHNSMTACGFLQSDNSPSRSACTGETDFLPLKNADDLEKEVTHQKEMDDLKKSNQA